MKITKRQLRRIILEFWDKDVERFLIDNAAEYHRDSTLDARSIRMLLLDDFMDNVGHSEDPADYEKLINKLAAGEIIEGRSRSHKAISRKQLRRVIRETTSVTDWDLGFEDATAGIRPTGYTQEYYDGYNTVRGDMGLPEVPFKPEPKRAKRLDPELLKYARPRR